MGHLRICIDFASSFNGKRLLAVASRRGHLRFVCAACTLTYLEPTDGGDNNPWRTRSAPCPFLKDNRCSVYDDRPSECRGYPYLDKPDFRFRLIGMVRRTLTCPIVYEVFEALKRSVGYRDRRRRR